MSVSCGLAIFRVVERYLCDSTGNGVAFGGLCAFKGIQPLLKYMECYQRMLGFVRGCKENQVHEVRIEKCPIE